MLLRSPSAYFSIGDYYKKKFKEKVYKISVSIADSCPNRKGLKGMETCIFCDEWGSAAYADLQEQELSKQIKIISEKLRARYKAQKFLIYFQSYTSTFLAVQKLTKLYKSALENPAVVGLVVGTRPDCISPALIKLWNSIATKTYLSVELGVQSFDDKVLKFLKRGHTAQNSIDAIQKIHEQTGADIGLHFILGAPNETMDDIKNLAHISNRLPIQNIKLHQLHVLKNTELEQLYLKEKFKPIDLPTYTDRVILFLENLNPNIAVQRLSAVSSRWGELVAPDWSKYKMKVTQHILDEMGLRHSFQGKSFAQSI